MGHTMSIHSRNDEVILEFGLKKPAFRIVVNSPTTHGSIGLTTGLDPAMTLGCGGYGGNITSDNISPRHLLNIKRLAYEITPAVDRPPPRPLADGGGPAESAGATAEACRAFRRTRWRAGSTSSSRRAGYARAASPTGQHRHTAASPAAAEPTPPLRRPPPPPDRSRSPLDFVCEDDVRQALKPGRKIVVASARS